jgi:glycerol uptake facilitator-like aquaporin
VEIGTLRFVPVTQAIGLVGGPVQDYVQSTDAGDGLWVTEIDPGLADTAYSGDVSAVQAIFAELVGTFILVFTVFGVVHRTASAAFAYVEISKTGATRHRPLLPFPPSHPPPPEEPRR